MLPYHFHDNSQQPGRSSPFPDHFQTDLQPVCRVADSDVNCSLSAADDIARCFMACIEQRDASSGEAYHVVSPAAVPNPDYNTTHTHTIYPAVLHSKLYTCFGFESVSNLSSVHIIMSRYRCVTLQLQSQKSSSISTVRTPCF